MSEDIVDRAEFDKKIKEMFAVRGKSRRTFWNKSHLNRVVKILLECKTDVKKKNEHYYFSKIYELVTVGDNHNVCLKKDSDKNHFVYVISYEDFYDKLMEAHLATLHGARDRMYFYCKEKWRISKEACQLFSNMCRTCARKRVKPVKGVVVKPIVTEGFNGRGQVDLIDLQSCPDGKIKKKYLYTNFYQ